MRSIEVTINEKTIKVTDMRIREMRDFLETIMLEADEAFKADKPSDLLQTMKGVIGDKYLQKLFPALTKEDIDNAYISEVEELVKAFIEVNFMGLKTAGAPILKALMAAPNSRK